MHEVQEEIVKNLIYASAGYGRAGLSLFRGEAKIYRNNQAAIGNLAIATELLIKGIIAKKNLLLLFKNIPLELKCVLCASKDMPESFNRIPYQIELRSSAFKCIELDLAVKTIGVFYPDIKKHLSAHLNYLSRYRNKCIHSALPDFQEYEVQRIVFLYLTLFKHFKEQEPNLLKYVEVGNNKMNEEFLTRFNEERFDRVHSAFEEARKKAKMIEGCKKLDIEFWDAYPVECPICGNDGYLYGDTKEEFEAIGNYDAEMYLTFYGESYECEECGLKLEDYDELEIAGIETTIDRTDEIYKWEEENMGPDYSELF